MLRLASKVAIVTASTDGIGYAIAKRLGREGASVIVSSRRQANVDRAVEQLRADGAQVDGCVCHVGKESDRRKLVETVVAKHGKIDIFVSNAAQNPHFGDMMTCTEEQWDKIFDVNIKASFFLAKDMVPHMKEGSSMVFVSSIGGYQPFELLGPYSVSKTALIGLSQALSKSLAGQGIRVNCLAPGIIKTKFSEALWKNDAVKEEMLKTVPLHRIGEPDEMAGAVAYMVSDDASYMTGETMVVAGGMQSRL